MEGYPVRVDEEYIKEVGSLFFSNKDEVSVLDINQNLYYVIPIAGTLSSKVDSSLLSLDFQMCSPYIYSYPLNHLINLDNTDINCIEEFRNNGINSSCLDVEIECISNGLITIFNRDKTITINMKAGEELKLIGDNHEIIGNLDSVTSGFDLGALELETGVNRIRISSSGQFETIWKWQEEYAYSLDF